MDNNSNKIRIITDAGTDINDEIIAGRDITVIPMRITRSDDVDFMSNEITSEQLFEDMRSGYFYTTSQISINTYLVLFEEYAKKNIPVIYIGLSSGLSGTISTANVAAMEIREMYPDCTIKIIDSKVASASYGFAAIKAYDMVEDGHTIEEVEEFIINYLSQWEHFFTVASYDFLLRGGRVSKSTAIIAGAMSIYPILSINETGRLEAVDKVRGHKKAVNKIIEKIKQISDDCGETHAHIIHTNDADQLESTISALKEKTNITSITSSIFGCVIGTHTGPSTLGIIIHNKNK